METTPIMITTPTLAYAPGSILVLLFVQVQRYSSHAWTVLRKTGVRITEHIVANYMIFKKLDFLHNNADLVIFHSDYLSDEFYQGW